jgi:hypothetical protein
MLTPMMPERCSSAASWWSSCPRQRVDKPVDGGHGERFDANKGTPMKEWFSLDLESALAWAPLAREALDFARGG